MTTITEVEACKKNSVIYSVGTLKLTIVTDKSEYMSIFLSF